MKAVITILLVLLFVILAVPGSVSCTSPVTKTMRDTSVQVWVDDYPEGTGIIVGDGTQVLAILDYYKSPIPDNVYVIYNSDETYEAVIQRVDFRTGATLLKISGGPFPVATTGSASKVKGDDKVLVFGWSFAIKDYEETEEGKKPVYSEVEFKNKSEVVVSTGITDGDFSFYIKYSEGPPPVNLGNIGQSDMVTDGDGFILGLVGTWFWGLVPPPGIPGSLPSVVSIDSILELVSENADQYIWTTGPSGYNFARPNGLSAYGRAPSNYEAVAGEILVLLSTLGESMEIEELLNEFSRFPFSVKTGNSLVAVYALPVDILSPDDDVPHKARWVVLRWNVPGESNCVIFGMDPYEPEGAFEITGDINILESLVSSEP